MKTILAGLMLIGSTTLALAQSATPNASTSGNTKQPAGLTEPQARYDAEAAGYSNVSNLVADGKGGWMGQGVKGRFTVSSDGKVDPR